MPVAASPPFDPGAVRNRLDALAPKAGPLLLGYSGGGDSHTLLLIAAAWARDRGRSLLAIIIDHGLRAESAGEARRAAENARALCVEARLHHQTSGSGPATGRQAWARDLRHCVFAAAAQDTGATALLLGHTADDQAETVWMRLLAGGGDRALAAMSQNDAFPSANAPPGLRILRPLLGQRRAAIRDWLREERQDWIDDPSNQDRTYTRVRTRRTLARLESAGLATGALTELANSCARLDRETAERAAHLYRLAIWLEEWGGARLDDLALARAPVRVARRALEAVIAAVAGQAGPVGSAGCDAVFQGLLAGRSASGAGCILHRQGGAVWLLRDPGALLGREGIAPLAPATVRGNEPTLWDGRFVVRSQLNGNAELACLGQLAPDLTAQLPDMSGIPALARQTLPVVTSGGTLLAIPGVTEHPRLTIVHKGHDLARRSLFAGQAPAWFDAELKQAVTDGSQNRG